MNFHSIILAVWSATYDVARRKAVIYVNNINKNHNSNYDAELVKYAHNKTIARVDHHRLGE